MTTEDYVDFTFINSSGSEITTSNYSRAHLLLLDDNNYLGGEKRKC